LGTPEWVQLLTNVVDDFNDDLGFSGTRFGVGQSSH
jgi:hypothetical protein